MGGPSVEETPAGELSRHGAGAGIVESHAVDQGFVRDDAKHPGIGIARLRMPGDSAQFREAETKGRPSWNGGGVFVHAGSQPDGVGKTKAKTFHWQRRRGIERFQSLAKRLVTTG